MTSGGWRSTFSISTADFEKRHIVEVTKKGEKRIKEGYKTCQFLDDNHMCGVYEAGRMTVVATSAGTSRTRPSMAMRYSCRPAWHGCGSRRSSPDGRAIPSPAAGTPPTGPPPLPPAGWETA